MARPLRFVPEDGGLVEVTCRTIQARLLLRPSPVLNEMIVGALGRAPRLYQVICHGLRPAKRLKLNNLASLGPLRLGVNPIRRMMSKILVGREQERDTAGALQRLLEASR
jgi:hypothetical protein